MRITDLSLRENREVCGMSRRFAERVQSVNNCVGLPGNATHEVKSRNPGGTRNSEDLTTGQISGTGFVTPADALFQPTQER